MPINGVAVGAIAVGSIFLYSAIKGKSILASSQAIITGKSPATVAQANPIIAPIVGTTAGDNSIGVQGSALPSAGSYSHAQVMSLWVQMGGSQASANNAACHAMQESSGNPRSTSANPDGGENVGLFQLDTKGVGAGQSVEALQNAENNTRITIAATKDGSDWSEWATPGC